MSNHDKATLLTLQYLDIIENNLKITWNAQGQPVCIIDWLESDFILVLRDILSDFLSGKLSEEARQATIEFGKAHIQTVGFGHTSDFDKFVKLGFIYGERVVLWDVILSRLIFEQTVTHRLKTLLAQAACNLLLLRPIAERGGLVILPHPISWSSLAAKVDAELRLQGNRSAADLGLSMALAAIEEGLPLHPYTLLIDKTPPTAQLVEGNHEERLYSQENYIFHSVITSLLGDKRMAFLEGVPANDFHLIVTKHKELQRALRKHFISDLKGLSHQQVEVELNHLSEDLIKLIEKRNKAVFDYIAEGGEATSTFAITAITVLKAGLPALDALATGGLTVALSTAIRKWVNRPEKNVIVQAFQELKEIDTQRQSYQIQAEEFTVIHESIAEIYSQFMSFSWTEERHHFLETLSPEVAKELLDVLEPNDLDVIVNYRRFQEDYIGDYLTYLWSVDEESFWTHIGRTFESPEGILLYDNDYHIRVMCSHDMPFTIWLNMINSILILSRSKSEDSFIGCQLDVMSRIFRHQTEVSTTIKEKRFALIELFNSLAEPDKKLMLLFLNSTYKHDLPSWFTDAVNL